MRPIMWSGTLRLSALLTPRATDAPWGKVPTIALSALAQDPRIPLTLEAVEFWNRQLAELGTPFRWGEVTQTTDTLPADYLTQLSATVLKREPPPEGPERVTRRDDRGQGLHGQTAPPPAGHHGESAGRCLA
jgi:hypothetical protein